MSTFYSDENAKFLKFLQDEIKKMKNDKDAKEKARKELIDAGLLNEDGTRKDSFITDSYLET